MHAYDIEMTTRPADRTAPDCQGWCFGLPPGIRTEQWPLDPNTGYPLMHGFTLLLPEDYRVHGPEVVALSFFAIAPDHNDGGPTSVDEISDLFEDPGEAPPSDPELLPFWQSIKQAHPRLHRMEDILGCPYALILLTRQEFEGPLCLPPRLQGHRLLEQTPPPRWLDAGSGAAYWRQTYSPHSDLPPEQYRVYRLLGGMPAQELAFNRALQWTPRATDPNAGKPPRESHGVEGGYQSRFYWLDGKLATGNYRVHAWAEDHQENHIGGTMRPVQGIPQDFSPFYVGFEEYLGGYNFGGGNAQLDFRDMKFDWAC